MIHIRIMALLVSSLICASVRAVPTSSQGRYLADVAGCSGCHTAANGPAYAGGDALKTAFGSIYAPNITPDPQTGIGSWSLSDFDRAVRRGVGKQGQLLYPAMPYTNYTKLSDADLAAIWEYVRTLPPVRHSVPANTFRFPYNLRAGLSVWQDLYFEPTRFIEDSSRSAAYNRGAYIVEVLAHCDACHSPRNFAQAIVAGQELTGGNATGWYAPDISTGPHSRIKAWSRADLSHFLSSGIGKGNTKAIGPMQEVVHGDLRHLTAADIDAIALYLKQAPPASAAPRPRQAAVSADRSRDQVLAGRTVYADHCLSCHKADGKGQPGVVPALAGNSAVTAPEPDNIIMAVLEGFKPQGTWGAMASFAQTLDDRQIADVVNYVRVAWGNGANPNATEWSIVGWRGLANPPTTSQTTALLCPNLPADELTPALKAGPVALTRASTQSSATAGLIAQYRKARPAATSAEIIEALSSAYCRTLADQHLSPGRAGAAIGRFSQRVAVALADDHRGGATGGR